MNFNDKFWAFHCAVFGESGKVSAKKRRKGKCFQTKRHKMWLLNLHLVDLMGTKIKKKIYLSTSFKTRKVSTNLTLFLTSQKDLKKF